MYNKTNQKLTVIALLTALNFLGTSTFRVYGLAPMQSITNIVGAVLLGPWPTFFIGLTTSLFRIFMGLGTIIAIPGAVVGALLAGYFYKYFKNHLSLAIAGEIIGTGIIGALLAAPLAMVDGNASASSTYLWAMFIPSFTLATIIGSLIASFLLAGLKRTRFYDQVQSLFFDEKNAKKGKLDD